MYVQDFHLFYELISIYVVICIMKFYFYIPVCSINSVIYEREMFHYIKQSVLNIKKILTIYQTFSCSSSFYINYCLVAKELIVIICIIGIF